MIMWRVGVEWVMESYLGTKKKDWSIYYDAVYIMQGFTRVYS